MPRVELPLSTDEPVFHFLDISMLLYSRGFQSVRVSPPSEKKIQLKNVLNTCVLKAILIILHILNISDHNFKTFETYF
jgi:predicted esterase YcpF (UPF0227 family)